ncbi:hypothetical protein GJU40_15665 [Bacillus lacus]|uniref:YufK family protein n=1 Tax=Metabacillus lacus TaxID=1983721 RepID=A0A7X2M0S7_9BACI|nr:DUF5366 family protein [Metabacillus lacus]MRX73582.1 hypothetical protein [Metabacillus lacus]
MKNTYFTSYFPLISILLFSSSLALSGQEKTTNFLKSLGMFSSMLELLSEGSLRLSLFLIFVTVMFMVFSALKLIGDTITELSLLFFSKDETGECLARIKSGAAFYLCGGSLSLLTSGYPAATLLLLLLSTLAYFVFIVYQISYSLTGTALAGLVFFHVLSWTSLMMGSLFMGVRLYNTLVASIPF